MGAERIKVGMLAQPFDAVLPPHQNSIGLIVYNTAMALTTNVDVAISLMNRPGLNVRQELPFIILPVDTPWHDKLESFSIKYPRWYERLQNRLGIGRNLDSYLAYARKAAADMRKESVRVSHIMNYWQWCDILSKSGSKVVLEMQGEWLAQMDHEKVAAQLEKADAIIGVSDHISNQFKTAFPDFTGHVLTAYNGVDTDIFKPLTEQASAGAAAAANNPGILFVGRLSPEKGIHILLQAFAEVVKAFPDAHLDLVGPQTSLRADFLAGISEDPVVRSLMDFYDGTVCSNYQHHIVGMIDRLDLGRNVKLSGALPHRELVEKYRNASLVVNPSFSESFGISVVEGMASGVPVVGTNIGGMQETIVDHQTGRRVDANNPEQLAEAMISILSNPELAAEMSRNGRNRVCEHFTWQARAVRLQSLYEDLLNE